MAGTAGHLLQVMQFWKKAERVMVYKRQSQLDARKKEAMDKHLSFLVRICPLTLQQIPLSRESTCMHGLQMLSHRPLVNMAKRGCLLPILHPAGGSDPEVLQPSSPALGRGG